MNRVRVSLFLVLSFFFMHGTSYAAKNNKGEMIIPCPLFLLDGIYMGVAAGSDTYNIDAKANLTLLNGTSVFEDATFSSNGAVGGAFFGYGKYLRNFHNAYIGVELFGNGSAADSNAQSIQLSNPDGRLATQVKIKNNYGIGFIPGVKLNHSTLLYIKLGYQWAHTEIIETLFNDGVMENDNETKIMSHGLLYGVGLETAFFEEFSLRAEYSHSNYHSFDTKIGTNVSSVASNQFMAGLIYHFC